MTGPSSTTTPIDGSVGLDPTDLWIEHRFTPYPGASMTPLDLSFGFSATVDYPIDGSLYIFLNGVLTADGIAKGWELEYSPSSTPGPDEVLIIRYRPSGGFAPNSDYGLTLSPVFTHTGSNCGDSAHSIIGGAQARFSTGLPSGTFAWTVAELSVDEIAQMNLDAPIVSYRNALVNPTEIGWRVDGSLDVGSDDSDLYRPASRAVDETGDSPAAGATGAATYYLVAESNGAVAADLAVVLEHNFAELDGDPVVTLEIADDRAFSSNLQAIATWTGSALDRRLVCVELGNGIYAPLLSSAGRFTARNWRLKIEYTGTGPVPRVGELFLAVRWTPPQHPQVPIAIDAEESDMIAWEPRSGLTRTLPRARQRAVPPMAWPILTDAELVAARAWSASIGAGAYPCVLVTRPGTAPEMARLVRVDEAFEAPAMGPFDRAVRVQFREQAPFVAREG